MTETVKNTKSRQLGDVDVFAIGNADGHRCAFGDQALSVRDNCNRTPRKRVDVKFGNRDVRAD